MVRVRGGSGPAASGGVSALGRAPRERAVRTKKNPAAILFPGESSLVKKFILFILQNEKIFGQKEKGSILIKYNQKSPARQGMPG
jgi:hypothetical protein